MKEVSAIADQPKDNVILFPKTIDYYQVELTRLLETERYRDAASLLEFLSSMDTDPRTKSEWQALLEWMRSVLNGEAQGAFGPETESETESDMLRRRLIEKTEEDARYVNRLIDTLIADDSMEKQLLALGQLIHIDHPSIDPALIEWIRNGKIYPLLRFKALQALKQRGAKGTVAFNYKGGTLEVDIEDTPLTLEEFPSSITGVLHRVQRVSEVNDPTLAYFAEQTWGDFLGFVYGSPVYARLLATDEAETDVWAAALHAVISEVTSGEADTVEIADRYGVTREHEKVWRQALQALQAFIRLNPPV